MRQLRALGCTHTMVSDRVAAGELHRVHKGVYAVGHERLTVYGRVMAAVLACGPDAVASHHAAAALHDLRPWPRGRIDVTAPGRRSHRGVRCHASEVPTDERTVIDGIPVTSLARTFLDYAETSSHDQTVRALEAAERREILDPLALKRVIDRHPGRHGIKSLTAALAAVEPDPPWLASGHEREFRQLLIAAGLPLPRTNVLIEGELVDCVWPEHRLIVEIDSFGFHRSKRQFEADRRRDAKLQALAWRVIRLTIERIRHDAVNVTGEIRALL